MKEFKIGDIVLVKYTDNDVIKGVVGTIVHDDPRDDTYLLRIYSADYPGVGWEMTGSENALPHGLVSTYTNDDRFNFYWVDATEIGLLAPKEEEEEVKDTAYHDGHYKDCVLEPIIVMQGLLSSEQFEGFLLGNALKYRLRAGHKENALSDIDKALRYEQWLKEFKEEGEITL